MNNTGRKVRLLAATTTMILVGSLLGVASASAASPSAAPGETGRSTSRFIVVLHDGVNPDRAANDAQRSQGARVDLIYRSALNGYAGTMSAQAAANISRDPRVKFVEADQVAHAADHAELPTGVDRSATPATQHTVPAHLTIDGNDDKRVNADVAVIDTGIDHNHPELNVVGGANCSGGSPMKSSCTTGLTGDDNGHGTHVAGTIGAIDNGAGVVGMAPGVRLHSVKVLRSDGSGYMSWIVAGIDWVTARGPNNGGNISVANMSLGCACVSSALDSALDSSVAAGVFYAVAAGNSDLDLKDNDYSPAKHPKVVTVSALDDWDGVSGGGATTKTCSTNTADERAAYFTNFDSSGTHIEVAAPGVCIRSTVPGGGYATYSGTSMASPHVAGAAALLTSQGAFFGSPALIESTIVAKGNTGWTDQKDTKKEQLLDVTDTVFTPATVPGDAGGGGETNSPPTASFTFLCTDLACDFDGTGSGDTDGSIATYQWDFGDDSTATGATVSHTYATDGTFTVRLTVTDNDGDTGTTSQTVTVSDSSSDPDPPATVTVTEVSPDTVPVGTTLVTINGTGFASGASVALLNGKGHTPTVSNVVVVSDTQLTASITVEKKGPSGSWDVQVTSGGTTGTCAGCLFVQR